jgi:hypothetical protein
MAERKGNTVSFRMGSEDNLLNRGVTSRAAGDEFSVGLSFGAVGARDLERYYRLIDRTLQGVVFSVAEASVIVDACNGTYWDTFSLFDGLALGLEDAISGDQLDQKWGIDGERLLAKLRALEPAQHLAIVDAIERFWHAYFDTSLSREEKLRAAGLVRRKRGVLTPKPVQEPEDHVE